MATDVKNNFKTCDSCLRFKGKPQQAELQSKYTTQALELIHMDFFMIEFGKSDKDINVLVVTDHFTCYVQSYVTPSQTASVVTNMLCDKFFVIYGLPEKLISDQGRKFETSLITELWQLA